MKKTRLIKKDYKRMIRELKERERWVEARLGEVQIMHQRAVSALIKERDELRQMLADKRDVLKSKGFSCNADITLPLNSPFLEMPTMWISGTSLRTPHEWADHYLLRMYFSSDTERVTDEQHEILRELFEKLLALAKNPDTNKEVSNV